MSLAADIRRAAERDAARSARVFADTFTHELGAAMPVEPLGTFVKDGVTKIAYSPGEVVELQFAGWTEQVAKPAKPKDKPAEKPQSK